MNTKLTLVELSRLLAASTSTSNRVCELFLRELFSTVAQELIEGHSVSIKNVGTFKVVESKSGKHSNSTEVQPVMSAERRRITFTPAKSLADAVNQPFAQFETVILDDALTEERLAEIDAKYPSTSLDQSREEPAEALSQATVIESPAAPKPSEPSKNSEPAEPSENSEVPETPSAHLPIERKPMLVGIPIDGPSHPVPEREPVEEPKANEYFHRPALRDAYSPTEEQLSASSKRDLRWLWGVLSLLVIGGLLWLLLGRQGSSASSDTDAVAIDTAEVYVEETVVTDTVTAKIVLTTLAEKHYGSPWFWVYIYEENKDKISNPNNIPPGMSVVIPPAEKYGINANDPASLEKARRRHWEIQNLGKR